MSLITTFEQLTKFVPFIASSDADTAMIDTTAAEQRYVVPVLTNTLYNTLHLQVANDTVPSGNEILLALARAVAAPMALYHNLALTQVRLTDTGLNKMVSENFDRAARWEYLEVKEQMLDQSAVAMEALLAYLVANASTHNWINPEYSGSIFKSADAFSKVYPLHQPHRTFMSLRPLIYDAESDYLLNLMDASFLATLKAATSEPELRALELAKKFVAHYAIYKAVEKLSIAITPQGFTVLMMAAPDQQHNGRRQAPDNQLGLLYQSAKADAKQYLSKLKNYLNITAKESVMSAYFNSTFYSAPVLVRDNRNSRRKGVFGL